MDWSQLGGAGTVLPHAFVSGGSDPAGDFVTGKFNAANSNKGELVVQSTNWNGNFNPGDYLVWTKITDPPTLTFVNGGYNFVGAYFQQNYFGTYCEVGFLQRHHFPRVRVREWQ